MAMSSQSSQFKALPSGEPIRLFAKLKAPGQNVNDLQISNNEIKIKNENKWTKFEHIFDQNTQTKNVFDSGLSKCIPFIIDGYSVSIFTFGTKSSDKGKILNESIPLIFNQLQYELSQKSKSFEIELSAIEIFDDTIYDLMDINKDNLVIEYGIDGVSILGISKTIIRSNNDFMVLLNEIYQNRVQKPTEFGSASSKSSFFLTLKIINSDNNTLSILQFIEFPAFDKLIENSIQKIRMKEGPTLNNEIIGLSNLINSFNNKSLINIVNIPYNDCKTNQLLQDSFGGNCLLFGICSLVISDSKITNKFILKLCNTLNLIENYPVINDNKLRGLLIKYHNRYNHILTQFELLKKEKKETTNATNTEAKLLQFRTLLIEKERELISLHGDKDKLSESYSQFRNKYNDLIEKNKKLQQEIILSEEKCLNISRTLIDQQLENNNLKNNESIIRKELETKLIGAENDILETGIREENLSKEIIKLKQETKQLLQEKKTLSIEYVALRANYNDINNQYDQQKDEQQQLNVQLINLINTNKSLQETVSRLTQENEILLNKNTKLTESKDKIELKFKQYEKEMMKIKTLNDKQGIELVKNEVEITRIKTAMDAEKTQYQQKWLKLSKEKEIELKNITNQTNSENQHNRQQIQQLQQENDKLKGQIRILNRQIYNQQNKDKQYQSEINTLNNELIKSREIIKEKTQQFRDKLLIYLQRVDINNDEINEIQDFKTTKNKLYQELIDQHYDREQQLMQQSEHQQKKIRKLYHDFQSLSSKFIALKDFVHDIAPDIDIPSNILIKENENRNNNLQEMEQYDDKLKNEINKLQRELEKEKRAHIDTAERVQIEQESTVKELLSLKKLLRDEHSHCDPMSHKIKQEYQENLSKLKALQLTLQQQIDHNKHNKHNQINTKSNDIDIEKYQKQIYKYKKKIQQLQLQLQAKDDQGNNKDNKDNEDNKNIKWDRIRKLEKEKAELIAKVHALESELATIDKHHKQEIQKYKKLIVKLKNK